MLPASLLVPPLCIARHQMERLWPAWSLVTRQRAPGHLRPDGVPRAAWSPSLNEPDVGVLFWAPPFAFSSTASWAAESAHSFHSCVYCTETPLFPRAKGRRGFGLWLFLWYIFASFQTLR